MASIIKHMSRDTIGILQEHLHVNNDKVLGPKTLKALHQLSHLAQQKLIRHVKKEAWKRGELAATSKMVSDASTPNQSVWNDLPPQEQKRILETTQKEFKISSLSPTVGEDIERSGGSRFSSLDLSPSDTNDAGNFFARSPTTASAPHSLAALKACSKIDNTGSFLDLNNPKTKKVYRQVEARSESIGRCAEWTRKLLDACGVVIRKEGLVLGRARDYTKDIMNKHGFSQLQEGISGEKISLTELKKLSENMVGDINRTIVLVFTPKDHKSKKAGHICLVDPKSHKSVSDCVQKSLTGLKNPAEFTCSAYIKADPETDYSPSMENTAKAEDKSLGTKNYTKEVAGFKRSLIGASPV